MFVVFEGIDGSGKTAISNRVAKALRASGLTVQHVREGGKLASPVAQSIRGFGRDERQLGLRPHAELLLNLARELQLLDEVTRPALASADVVIADRFLASAEVLACAGRGLPADEVRPLVEAVSPIVPDVVILVDVDPNIARARRRIAKLVSPPAPDTSPSRKGQAGFGLLCRMRAGYLEMAAHDPARWRVVDNSELELQTVVDVAVGEVRRRVARAAPEAATDLGAAQPRRRARSNRALRPGEALTALLAWVDGRARTEPSLAAYLLAGLWGPDVERRRRAVGERAPEITAWGLLGLGDAAAWRWRHELAARAPRQVARSLAPPTPPSVEVEALRARLAPRVPAELAASTRRDPSLAAAALREALFAAVPDAVVASLATLGDAAAWALRDRWLAERGATNALDDGEGARLICRSVTGLDDERAWQLRTAARDAAPTAALASLAGLGSERAWRWRREALELAPKAVLSTIVGLDDPRAWDLREAAAYRCREAIDSALDLGGPRAWRLREACADLWPGAVLKSLGAVAASPEGVALVARQLSRHADDLSVLQHAAGIELATPRHGETRAA